jgi:large subunit ribosomal protein L6
MSRIGRAPVIYDPQKVKVEMQDHRLVVTRLTDSLANVVAVHPEMRVDIAENRIVVERPSESKSHKSLHGLTRSLIANAVEGLTSGYRKVLEVYGVGYRVVLEDRKLVMQLGFSHPVEVHPPASVTLSVQSFTPSADNQYLTSRITLEGWDKQTVGELAAKIRAVKKPEPYKGKGIRYQGEVVRRKAGKTAKAVGA